MNLFTLLINASKEKNKIKAKLKDIVNISDYLDINCNRFLINCTITEFNKTDLEEENEKYKNIAKLSTDLYLDYKYYKQFTIKNKSQFENCECELRKLGYILQDNGEWISDHEPDRDQLVDYIFMSCLFQSVLETSMRSSSECQSNGFDNEIEWRENEKDQKKIWNCCYEVCRFANDINEKYCKLCGIERLENPIYGSAVYFHQNYDRVQVWVCGRCQQINEMENYEFCSFCNIAINEAVEFDEFFENQQSFNEQAMDKDNKWKCIRCASLNDFELLTCRQCESERIYYWKCSSCKLKNNMSRNECNRCGANRYCFRCKKKGSTIKGLCERCRERSGTRWKCQYINCGKENNNKKYCQHCGINRFHNRNWKTAIRRQLNESMNQIWICSKCFNINDWNHKLCSVESCKSKRNIFYRWCTCGTKIGVDRRCFICSYF